MPADRPSIGIVVPAYQAERFLGATLRSIEAQTFRDWRCVVIDDGSTDGTATIARQHAASDQRFELVQQRNRGLVGARHAGVAECLDCEAIIFVDSDDTLELDALETLWAVLAARPDATGASALADYMDADGRPIHVDEHPALQRDRLEPARGGLRHLDRTEDTTFASLTVEGRIWPTAVALLRLKAVVSAGLFDEQMVPQEDWEFYLRLARLGPIAYLDQRVAWYRRHEGNATKDAAQAAISAQQRLRAKTWRSRQTDADQKDAILCALDAKQSWERLRHARQVKAALVARRPAVAVAAAVCVILGAYEQPHGRPRPSPGWLVAIGVVCRRFVRDSGVGHDEGRGKVIV